MSGNGYLLDTNIVIAILNQEPAMEDRLKGKTIHLPSIALGELYYGMYKSARVVENIERLERFIVGYPIIACDQITANHYGRIRISLQAKGRPIPENDIWIAAIAQQHDLTLVTRDDHFEHVADLTRERWT